jgi:hypothetical protein
LPPPPTTTKPAVQQATATRYIPIPHANTNIRKHSAASPNNKPSPHSYSPREECGDSRGPQDHTAFSPHPANQRPTDAPTGAPNMRYLIDRLMKTTKTSEKEEAGILQQRHHTQKEHPTNKPRTNVLGNTDKCSTRGNKAIESARITELSYKRKGKYVDLDHIEHPPTLEGPGTPHRQYSRQPQTHPHTTQLRLQHTYPSHDHEGHSQSPHTNRPRLPIVRTETAVKRGTYSP